MRGKLSESRLRTAASQIQVRLVGQLCEDVEAALEHLQKTAGLQVLRGVQQGKKGDWLAYASVSIPLSPSGKSERALEAISGGT